MTTSFKKRRNKKILALCLSAFMVSAAAVSFAACGDNDSSVDDSEVTTTEKDTARIRNGSFEFFDDSKGKNVIITSPDNWTKSTGTSAGGSAALSSKKASGIVDTSEDAWKQLTTTSSFAHDTKAEAKANWDKLTVRDRLEFYKTWEEEDDENKLADLDFYDKDKHDYNVDFDALPDLDAVNPGTHYAEGDEEAEKNQHVLMLHNAYSDKRGTAQKYTTASITVEPGTSAKFSVWVKTQDLTFADTEGETQPVNGERGAYIGVTHAINGTNLDQMQVKNIDTEAINPQGDDNGWVQYHFYFKGCSYASSSFTVVLGLGQGGGTDKFEYVDGYAFFDDVECSIISNEDYDKAVEAANIPDNDVVGVFTDAEDKLFRADKDYKAVRSYAIDLHSAFDVYSLGDKSLKTGLTEEKSGNKTYVSGKPSNGQPAAGTELYGDLNRITDNDVVGLYSLTQLKANQNQYVKNILGSDFEKYPFQNENVLMLLSADGAAYTSTLKDESAFTLAPDSYLMLSFWLKTSDISGFTGAGVTLHETEGTNENSLSSLDTTSITTVDIDGKDGETIEDIYDGWQQCFFFVQNTTETEKSFYLTFSYGPTTIVGTNNSSYYAGYAAFANFETMTMTEKQFKYAATGTYAKSVSLTGEELTSASEAGFDTPSTIPDKQIEEGLAIPKNYKGVNGGSGYVVAGGEDKEVNGYEYAGLINKKYADNYFAAATDENYWLHKLADSMNLVLDEKTWWNDIFGTATQPLLIYNDETKSYGYIGSSQTISGSSYATVSVKVKVSAGAKAYIYLIDTTESEYDKTLSITTPKYTYWYDDEGNVCAKDPSDKKFNKKTDVAFYLNDENGLYEVNKNWSGYTAEMAGKYYANLSNYEKDEDTQNLLVKDGGVSYNYDKSVIKNEGNDGIAFYYNGGKYYAYKNHTVEVTDLASVAALTPRYKNADGTSKDLMMTVGDTKGEWVTCTFYIHTGNAEKKYRLEVWDGDREGTEANKSAAGSHVIFDANALDSVDSKYADLVNETVDMIKEKNNWTTDEEFKENYDDAIYYAYSFFDSPSFLRYDSTLDKDEVGNSYTSYKTSSHAEGVAYLYYEDFATASDNPLYTMFVDYSYTEVTVTADSSDSGDNDDNQEENENDTNMWLFVSSLVIAIALIVAVVGLLIQKLVKKAHLKKARSNAGSVSSVNAAKRRYTKKTAADVKKDAPAKKEAPKDDNDPYND